jgi:hypothetical protein
MTIFIKKKPIIRFKPELWDIYAGSLRMRPPEQMAILGGSYDDPFTVTNFRPMPAKPNADGSPNASSTHVQLNKPYIDHFISNELKPAGRSMTGAIHSHPGNFTRLSGSVGGDYGDIPAMRATLERAQAMGWPWEYFLAPIITFNDNHTMDTITGWVITLSEQDPIPAEIVFEENDAPKITKTASFSTAEMADYVLEHLNIYQIRINTILNDTCSPPEDKDVAVSLLRRLRDHDLKNLESRAMQILREEA